MDFDFARVMQIAQLYPDEVQLLPLGAGTNCQGMARKNAKRDAYIKLSIEDEWVKALQDPDPEKRPLLFTIYVPRHLLDRAAAPIILPGDMASLVLPGRR